MNRAVDMNFEIDARKKDIKKCVTASSFSTSLHRIKGKGTSAL